MRMIRTLNRIEMWRKTVAKYFKLLSWHMMRQAHMFHVSLDGEGQHAVMEEDLRQKAGCAPNLLEGVNRTQD